MISVRGATTVENDNKEEVIKETEDMLTKILEDNNIDIINIVSIVFTTTKDIKSVYPAIAARNLGITSASLICVQEMHVEGSLKKCIRVMVTCNMDLKQKDVNHVYLNKAKNLRLDLKK